MFQRLNRKMARYLARVLAVFLPPLVIVRAYRMIPAPARGAVFGGPSTSHLALSGIRAASTAAGQWAAFWGAVIDNDDTQFWKD